MVWVGAFKGMRMKKTPNQVLQFVEDFAKTNGMDIFKGMIDIDPGSQFLSITWDDAGEDGIEPFLQIAKNNSIKLLYIFVDIYSKDEFAKLRDSYNILLQNKSTAKDLKDSFREALAKLESLDEYDKKALSTDFSFIIENRVHTYTATSDWIDIYDEVRADLDSMEEDEEEEED
jgi:hypothetical protein